MIEKLKKMYKDEQFNPRFIGLFINPFYFARRGLYVNISNMANNLKGRLLDIGCGTKPYKNLLKVKEYIGLEVNYCINKEHKNADVFYDGTIFPFKDKKFDSILSNQVFEHVFNPDEFLKEVNRVTKLGGFFLISVPFIWDEHEQPCDYARYTSFGLKFILQKYGFEVVLHKKSCNGIEAIFQLLNSYIYKKIFTKNKYLNLVLTLGLIAPINIFGLLISKVLFKNDDLYLDNIFLLRKMNDV